MLRKTGKSISHMLEMKRADNENCVQERAKLKSNAEIFLQRKGLTTEKINCPVCDSSEYVLWDTIFGFEYSQCQKCDLIFLNPHPTKEAINEYYTSDVYKYNSFQSDTFNEQRLKLRLENVMKPRVDFVAQFGKIKTWLDIGCGNGEMVSAVPEITDGEVFAFGVEPSADCVDYAKKYLNTDLVHSEIEEYLSSVVSLDADVVSMFGVLEHIPNPKHVVKLLQEKMKSGSLFVFLVPVGLSFSALVQKGNHDIIDRHLVPPAHITLWSEKSIEKVTEDCGFSVVGTWQYGQDCFELLKLLQPSFTKKEKEKFLEFMPSLQKAVDETSMGDEIIVVAQKI